MNYRKIPYYGLFAALAILMGYVEFMIPVPVPIPGVKLGLANVIVIIMLYFMDTKSAFFVSLIRVLLSGLLFAGFAGMLYSLAGALCSFAVMPLQAVFFIMSVRLWLRRLWCRMCGWRIICPSCSFRVW